MNILDRWWKRLLISLFLSGIFSKGISVLTRRKVEISALVFLVVIYFVLRRIYENSESAK